MLILALMAALDSSACINAHPENFLPGIVSTDDHHESLDWRSSDGKQLIFTRANSSFSASQLFYGNYDQLGWQLEALPFSTGPFDAGFARSKSGTSALFTSTRATPSSATGGWNIWQVSMQIDNAKVLFDPPTPLPAPVNSEALECCAVFEPNGDIFFSSNRAGSWDIYRAALVGNSYEVDLLSGSINSDAGEWPSFFISQSESLLMSSIQASGMGGDDIYLSRLSGDQWGPAFAFPAPVNSPFYDDSARIFGDQLFWSSRRDSSGNESVHSNIFSLPIDCLAPFEIDSDLP